MKPKVLVGIAGGTCSGKSLVSERIVERVGEANVLIFKQDNYYRDLRSLSPSERVDWNFDRPEAFDSRLLHEHMNELMKGNAVEEPVYSYIDHIRLDETTTLQPQPVIIIEGILVLADAELREMMDFKVYVDEAADIRLARRIRRDELERGRSAMSVLEQYEESVRPMHIQFVEPSKHHADIILPRGGENIPAIEILANHIHAVLNEK